MSRTLIVMIAVILMSLSLHACDTKEPDNTIPKTVKNEGSVASAPSGQEQGEQGRTSEPLLRLHDSTGQEVRFSVDPCALVPVEKVEAFLGEAVIQDRRVAMGIPPMVVCAYNTRVPESEKFARSPMRIRVSLVDDVLVRDTGYPSLDSAEKVYVRHRDTLKNNSESYAPAKDLPVPGYWETGSSTLSMYTQGVFLKLQVKLNRPNKAQTMSELQALQREYDSQAAQDLAAVCGLLER